ncbi:MAG: hypothetical protein C4576_33365 [Desulfobacteraceae bacterium]|nr:MAG: hypothetical protein C4576_33365 [Desulfobacteraceae bacterium]
MHAAPDPRLRTHENRRGGEALSHLKSILLILLVIGLGITSVIFYSRRELKIPELSLKSSQSKSDSQVDCLLVARLGDRHLRMGFYMPAEDRKQRDDLLKKLPAIKHDLLMSAGRADFLSALEIRDFDSIREYLLETVNLHAREPVDSLFFQNFHFD